MDGYQTEEDIFNTAASPYVELKTISTCYNGDTSNCNTTPVRWLATLCWVAPAGRLAAFFACRQRMRAPLRASPSCRVTPITQTNVITTLGASGSNAPTSEVITKYDYLGNPIESDIIGYGAGTVGPLLRRTQITRGGAYDMPSQITVDSGANTPVVAETAFSYDAHGNATEIDESYGPAAGDYLKRVFTYSSTG